MTSNTPEATIKDELDYKVNHTKSYSINSELNKIDSALFYYKTSSKFLIAAPHHASDDNDVKTMRTLRGTIRTYDANTGFICLNIAKALGSSYLIFNNALDDPNKIPTNEYCKHVKSHKPSLLVEIHGHAGKSVDDDVIEISGGLHNNEMSIRYANLLEHEFMLAGMKHVECIGDFNSIFYKAAKTPTVNGQVHNSGNNRTLHIELPKSLRKLSNVNKVSKILISALSKL